MGKLDNSSHDVFLNIFSLSRAGIRFLLKFPPISLFCSIIRPVCHKNVFVQTERNDMHVVTEGHSVSGLRAGACPPAEFGNSHWVLGPAGLCVGSGCQGHHRRTQQEVLWTPNSFWGSVDGFLRNLLLLIHSNLVFSQHQLSLFRGKEKCTRNIFHASCQPCWEIFHLFFQS